MSISGSKREPVNFTEQPKYVGLFLARVIAVNPDAEEFEEMMGYAPKEDSKQFEYLGESKDGNTSLRVDIWLEDRKSREREDGTVVFEKFKVTFFLENAERVNKDGTRNQYINKEGICSWADDPNNLPDWFKKKEYRPAHNGEEQLYNFVRVWLSKFDFRGDEGELDLEWKKLMKGNVKLIREHVNGEWSDDIICLATITSTEKEGEIKEYQRIYNDAFLYGTNNGELMKFFRATDFSNPDAIARLKAKKPRDLKSHEKFILNITHPEYGCRDYFELKDLAIYDPAKNITSTSKVIVSDDASY